MSKSTVNKAGNYTKPGMRKRKFQQIKAGSKGGPPGVWSARKAQLLARSYKAAGGGYKEDGGEIKKMASGGMAKSQKSLKNWSDADWDYVSKGDEKKPKSQRGRYLPKSVRQSLTPSQKASTNAKKRAASASGKTSAKYSKDVARKVAAASKFAKGGSTAAWQRKEGKDPKGGLNRKGVASYRAANPGSKLKMAVTTKPSKLKKGSKAANRRKSFCARMSGMKKKLTSSKTANDPNSRINKSLRKWNCEDGGSIPQMKKGGSTRNYKDEYKKFQSSIKMKKYRAELNKYNRKNGKYGNGDGKDASHKKGKIAGYESASTNRGRKTANMKKKKPMMKKGGLTKPKSKTRTAKIIDKLASGAFKGAEKFEKTMGIDPRNTEKQNLGIMGGTMASTAAAAPLGPLAVLPAMIGGARLGKKLMTKKKKTKKSMAVGGKLYKAGMDIRKNASKNLAKLKLKKREKALMKNKNIKGDIAKPTMKQGGSLKPVDKAKNPGLSKLPTSVRNKMGYMKKGGMIAKKGQFVNKRTGKPVPAGTKYHMHPEKGPMAGAEHNPKIKGGKKGHDFFVNAKAYGGMMKKMMGGGMIGKMAKDMVDTRQKMKMGGKTKKPVKYMNGGAVKAHLGSVHKSAGDSVATYQASNSNYKEGQ